MIKIEIRELAEKRGVVNAYQLQKLTGFPSNMAARLWKNDVEKIGVGTMDTLCTVLRCKPNDLFKFESGE